MSARAPDRRAFLGLSLGAAVCAASGCASIASVPLSVVGGRVRVMPRDHPALEGPGGFLKIRPDGWELPLYLLRDDGGELVALSPLCTHLGCVVEVEGRALVCPCHGSTYALGGDVVRGPAERPLRRFPIVLEPDGALRIDVSRGER